jgi:hypothetical protein
MAAELAACWKRCKGAMAELASGLSEETLKMALPYLARAWRQLFLERLCRHTSNLGRLQANKCGCESGNRD